MSIENHNIDNNNQILESSTGQFLPTLCPHREFCGGCSYQGFTYEESLLEKEKQVLQLLEKEDVDYKVFDKIKGCPPHSQFSYRNKMEYTFGDLVKDGPLELGMHKKGHFMSIITVNHCQLVHDDFNKVLSYTLNFAKEKGYVKYHKKTHEGLLRNLIIRRGVNTEELLINIVTATGDFDEDSFTRGLLRLNLSHKIVGILRTINDGLADAVNVDDLKVLYGQDYYTEKLLGLTFKVSAFSFFQTSIEAVTRLYTDALSLIDGFDNKVAFDLYCGTGTITQLLATKAKDVWGVEIVEEAVASAKENAKMNGINNCNFICGDVFEVLSNLDVNPDVLVVDPPRMGIGDKAVDKLASYGVPQILYISCNPKTLAKNLARFQALGYRATYVKPYDNFPWTKHVECVCLLSKVQK